MGHPSRRFVRAARSDGRREILRRCAPLDDSQKRVVRGKQFAATQDRKKQILRCAQDDS